MVIKGLVLGGIHHQREVDTTEKVNFQIVELLNCQIGKASIEFRFETDLIEKLLSQDHSTLDNDMKRDDAVITFFMDVVETSP